MSTSHTPYLRGFILSSDTVTRPLGFIDGPHLPHFYIHPWTAVEHAKDLDGRFVIVLGTCISTLSESDAVPAARALLWALQDSEEVMLRSLDRYCGRHVIIYGDRVALKAVSDAAAMRSVFYADSGGVIASHALMVENAIASSMPTSVLPFRFAYPGNRTPYAHTKLLTANTLYDLRSRQTRRFWPTEAPPKRTVDEAAAEVLRLTATALRTEAARADIRLALTAGLDSRLLLAIAMHAGVEINTFTYGSHKDTAVDRAFARDLARANGVRHTVISTRPPSPDLKDRLHRAHYKPSHHSAVAPLQEWFGAPTTVVVNSNLVEIGRSFYKPYRQSCEAPTTARSMAELHRRSEGSTLQPQIHEYGESAYREACESAFDEFARDAQFNDSAGYLDPADQFYWEHRMSAWYGPALLERDFYAIPFIPFNSRNIFISMLGVDRGERDAGSVMHRVIEMAAPQLADFPFNPKVWPQPAAGHPATD